MGGLVDSQTVKGDLWMVEVGNGSMACYPVNTTSEGPGPRVGHSSLLVGNAFIVFGGDTKLEEGDVLDDTLYLLNICMSLLMLLIPMEEEPNTQQQQRSNGHERHQQGLDLLADMVIH
jgi:hypothetical protein